MWSTTQKVEKPAVSPFSFELTGDLDGLRVDGAMDTDGDIDGRVEVVGCGSSLGS